MADSWQAMLGAQAYAADERAARRDPKWVIRATFPKLFTQVWCLRYTREMLDAGVRVAEDLSLMSTCYESRIVADFRTCEDGMHALCEFLPPVETLAVRPECMSGVVAALRRSGYHAICRSADGKSYEF